MGKKEFPRIILLSFQVFHSHGDVRHESCSFGHHLDSIFFKMTSLGCWKHKVCTWSFLSCPVVYQPIRFKSENPVKVPTYFRADDGKSLKFLFLCGKTNQHFSSAMYHFLRSRKTYGCHPAENATTLDYFELL